MPTATPRVTITPAGRAALASPAQPTRRDLLLAALWTPGAGYAAWTARLDAIRALWAYLDDPAVVADLVAFGLADGRASNRLAAVRTLLPVVSEPAVRDALVRLAQHDPCRAVRVLAVQAVEPLVPTDAAVPAALLDMLGSLGPEGPAAAAALAGHVRHPHVRAACVARLRDDPHWRVRFRLVEALRTQVGDPLVRVAFRHVLAGPAPVAEPLAAAAA
ncbi:MAG: hypothetical protein KGJ86_00535 [Chloroflexota bacterium]|nr:hypothetical protein [Chloroflexota bacterium]